MPTTGMRIFRIRHGHEAVEASHDRDGPVMPLSQLMPGESGQVVSIQGVDKAILQKLLAMTVIPGSRLQVELTSPVVVFRVENTRVALDNRVAGEIRVKRIET